MVNALTKIKRSLGRRFAGWKDPDTDEYHFSQGVTSFSRWYTIDNQYCINMPEGLRNDPKKTNPNLMFINRSVWDRLLPKLEYLSENLFHEIAEYHKKDPRAWDNYCFILGLLPDEQ